MKEPTNRPNPYLFNRNGYFIAELPGDCVSECSAAGSCDEAVAYWTRILGWTCNREQAVAYLKPFGAWTQEELDDSTDEELDQRILWIACGDVKEQGEWLGLVH